ncbi:MAG TPA: superoxide dismutase [Alphaproteobacteria bacterium]
MTIPTFSGHCLSRRAVVLTGVAAVATFAAPYIAKAQTGPFQMRPLPWKDDALSPVISATTIGFHYGKHQATYLQNLNSLLANDDLKSQPLVEIIKSTAANPTKSALFNNAAQFWNHDFYWDSMKPGGGGKPTGRMAEMVDKSFGDYDKFKTAFAGAATGVFGSGWAWLCAEADKLTIRRTSNADTPVYVAGVKPLLTIDVWEHAYYLDYQNRRADYVNALIDKLLNWNFADKNLGT